MVNIIDITPDEKQVQPCPTVYHSAVVVQDKMYVLGGLRSNKALETSVFVLDLTTTNKWTILQPTGKVPSTRCLSSCVAVKDKIYCFGGYHIETNAAHKCYNGLYVYDTSSNTWDHIVITGACPEPRAGSSMIYWKKQLVLYGGSQGRHIFFGDCWSFDIATQVWKKIETTGAFPKRRACHTASIMGDLMIVFGGIVANSEFKSQHVTNELLILNLETVEWYEPHVKGQKPEARSCHVAIPGVDEILISCGGDLLNHSAELEEEYLCDMFVFDLKTNKWARVKENVTSTTLAPLLGLSMVFDHIHHRLVAFGGKLADNTIINAVQQVSFEKDKSKSFLQNLFSNSKMDVDLETQFMKKDILDHLPTPSTPPSLRKSSWVPTATVVNATEKVPKEVRMTNNDVHALHEAASPKTHEGVLLDLEITSKNPFEIKS